MSKQKQALLVVQENILFSQKDGQASQLTVGTPAWYTWLNTATAFAFRSTIGTFTARREQAGHRCGGWYWRAYRKHKGKLHQVYMGKAQDLTYQGPGKPCSVEGRDELAFLVWKGREAFLLAKTCLRISKEKE